MPEFEVQEDKPVQPLPRGGDGWFARLLVIEGEERDRFNLAVSDRRDDPPTITWFQEAVRALVTDTSRTALDQLRARPKAAYDGLDHPVIWL